MKLSKSRERIASRVDTGIGMDIILSHNNLDCDGLAAILAMHRLRPQAIPVLLGSLNRNVRDLLTHYERELPFRRLRDLPKQHIDRIILVDIETMLADEGLLARLQGSKPSIDIFDHHPLAENPIPGATITRADTGATTTILVEMLQDQGISISAEEATILLLGIYEDTGNLTYTSTTPRDIRASAWLLERGANLAVVTDYLDRPLSPRQWQVYEALLSDVTVEQISGYAVLLSAARSAEYVEEVSTLAHKLTDQYEPDASFILVEMESVVQVIARSRNAAIDVSAIVKPLGGGGHAPAAAALVRNSTLAAVRDDLWAILREGLAPEIVAADIMTRELHSVNLGMTIAGAYDRLRRYGHEALPIMDNERLVGLIMRRDAEKALYHGLGSRPVEAFATFDMPTITMRTPLVDIQDIMKDSNIGQLPVLEGGRLAGIVTRTDVIRRWRGQASINLAGKLRSALAPDMLHLLTMAGETAAEMGFSLYLVGGFVRDLLLGLPNSDLDLVVEGDAIALASRLAAEHGGRMLSHSRFGTAKWLIVPGETVASQRTQALDFVTARTEFYEHPAALPQVEASSLRHDLYRRDFTINTMAICLNGPRYGELVDFYGGKADLERRLIRVLHNLSFVDDATRILRAARLAERLGFTIEDRTASLISDAWDSLERVSGDRLRHEMDLAFQESEPERIIKRLDDLGVLAHLCAGLRYTPWLAERYAAVRRALPEWQSWGWGDGSPAPLMSAYTALLAYHLSQDELQQFMARLNIAGHAGHTMRQVWSVRLHVTKLSAGLPASQVYHSLRPYPIEAIVIVAIAEDSPILRQAIASYLQTLRYVRTEIDGDTLRSLGIAPGPLYSTLLQAVLDARLDGRVKNRAEEEQLLQILLADPGTRQ
jgi:tRNA nucleotidyltransferase (CCA-adding enzyme)